MKSINFRFLFLILFAIPLIACDGGGDGDEGGEGSSFTSSGISRGISESLLLSPNESYAGLLNNIEVAVLYDAASDTFIGRIKNEDTATVCDVRVSVVIDGVTTIGPSQIDVLSPGGGQDFTLVAGVATFSEWIVEIESFTCIRTDDGEHGEGGEEGGGHDEGGEGSEGGEGGEEGGGHDEGGEESNPSIPLDQPVSGVLNNLTFSFAYDDSTGAFRGDVENQTNQLVCRSRVEIHLAVGSQVIELGPTIGVDLASGEIMDVVIEPGGIAIDSYALHPESSPCP
jgi:hypothetical protein